MYIYLLKAIIYLDNFKLSKGKFDYVIIKFNGYIIVVYKRKLYLNFY